MYFKLVGNRVVRFVKGRLVEPPLNIHQSVIVVRFADGLIDFVEDFARALEAATHLSHLLTTRLCALGEAIKQQRILSQTLHSRRDDIFQLKPSAHGIAFRFGKERLTYKIPMLVLLYFHGEKILSFVSRNSPAVWIPFCAVL